MAVILVCDDDKGMRDICKMLLEADGHAVTTVDGGEECLRYLMCVKYDLLVLDIAMPDVDGNEVMRRMPDDAPPVVVVTGFESKAIDTTRAQVKCVLTKPFGAKELTDAANRTIGLPVKDCP